MQTPRNGHRVQQAEKIALKQLLAGRPRTQIITLLCEEYAMSWAEAESFLLDVEIGRGPVLRSNRRLLLVISMAVIVVGSLSAGLYLLFAIVSQNPINLRWAILSFASGTGLVALALTLYSGSENRTKERHRCPHCGYLTNRAGHEQAIFLPRYEASTYHTEKRLLSTQSEEKSPTGEDWDINARYEISKVCRRCRKTRSTEIVEEKRSYRLGPPRAGDSDQNWR